MFTYKQTGSALLLTGMYVIFNQHKSKVNIRVIHVTSSISQRVNKGMFYIFNENLT